MQIQIPAGTAPNAVLQVRAPDGRTIKVRVPPNVRPGQQMRVAVPAAAAPEATKPAAVPANPSRGRLPVAGLVGKSFGLYQKDQKAWLALDETKRLVKIDVGHRFSRKSAKKLCEERGGRLAYRREVVDEATLRHRLSLGAAVELVGLSNAEFNGRRGVVAAPPADLAAGRVAVTVDGRTLSLKRENVVAARSASVPRLLVNDGKAFGGDKWIPVLDGDPNKDDEGVGWVQIGDPGRLGKNHREAHGADCTWGGLSQAPHWKGPWIYCVIDEAVTTKTGNWAGWDVANFVAFEDAGDNRVAFRNPGTKRWLRVTPDGETQAPTRGEWNDSAKEWECFELHDLAEGVGLRSASGRWLTIGGKRTIELEPLGAWNADERAAAHEKKLAEEMERIAAADRAEAERRAAELRRFAAAAQAPAAAPEAVAPELPAGEASRAEAVDAGEASRAEAVDEPPTTERIDCDSPRVDLGGESELSARIDALFRVKRSPALAAQLNKIYEHHESIPRYTT